MVRLSLSFHIIMTLGTLAPLETVKDKLNLFRSVYFFLICTLACGND